MVAFKAYCGPSHLLRAEVAHAHCTNFACLNSLCHQIHQFLNAQQRVGKMNVVQVYFLQA
jgi:hypothetical protein